MARKKQKLIDDLKEWRNQIIDQYTGEEGINDDTALGEYIVLTYILHRYFGGVK